MAVITIVVVLYIAMYFRARNERAPHDSVLGKAGTSTALVPIVPVFSWYTLSYNDSIHNEQVRVLGTAWFRST